MNIVDPSNWIEYIADTANADFFEPIIVNSENLVVPTICWYEVFKRVLQEYREERARDAMSIMSLGTIVDRDRQIAVPADHIYTERKLVMADSIILATARACDATLWTRKNISGALKAHDTKRRRRRINRRNKKFACGKGLVCGAFILSNPS